MSLGPVITAIVGSQQMFRWQIRYVRKSARRSSSIIKEGILQNQRCIVSPC